MLRCPVAAGQKPKTQEPTSTEVRKQLRDEVYKTFVQAPLSIYANSYIQTLSKALQNRRPDISIVSLIFMFTDWEFAATIPAGKDILKDISSFSGRSGKFEGKVKVTFKHNDKERIVELPGMVGKLKSMKKVNWEKYKKPNTEQILQAIAQAIDKDV